jgi:hypothetical protein
MRAFSFGLRLRIKFRMDGCASVSIIPFKHQFRRSRRFACVLGRVNFPKTIELFVTFCSNSSLFFPFVKSASLTVCSPIWFAEPSVSELTAPSFATPTAAKDDTCCVATFLSKPRPRSGNITPSSLKWRKPGFGVWFGVHDGEQRTSRTASGNGERRTANDEQ